MVNRFKLHSGIFANVMNPRSNAENPQNASDPDIPLTVRHALPQTLCPKNQTPKSRRENALPCNISSVLLQIKIKHKSYPHVI